MSILKNKLSVRFSQLPNELITDTRLSHGAFRVAAYLFSKPDGWNILNVDIQKQLGIGQSQTLANYWKELIKCGWVSRQRKRNGNIITGGFDYELSLFMENPQCEKTNIREDAKLAEVPTHINTELFSNTNSSINTDSSNSAVGDVSEELEVSITEILETLNSLAGRSLPIHGERAAANRLKVKRLLDKKYTAHEIKAVVQTKCFEWGNDAKMMQYLHPTTLFVSGNFQKYLDQYQDLKSNPDKAEKFKKSINGKQGSGNTGPTIISESTKRDAIRELFEEGYFDNGNKH